MNINDGTSSGLYLTSAEQGYIQSGWAGVVIGSTSNTGGMSVGASTWVDPLTLITGSGVITISAAQAMGSNNFTLQTNVTPTFSSTVTQGKITSAPRKDA